jgi:hypothetical protein
MGIGRVQARALIAAVKAGANRTQCRVQIGDAVNLLNDWLAKRDVQDAAAVVGFAADKPAQFNTFVDSLPEIPVDQTP